MKDIATDSNSLKLIKSHKDLARVVQGKRVLHLNSLGKDSALCLEWLVSFAKPSYIQSLFFQRFTVHPSEARYLAYLKNRYPSVEFVTLNDPNELNMIIEGDYQPPELFYEYQKFEYEGFSRPQIVKEKVSALNIDFVCDGRAGYEGLGRAQKFHNKGLLHGNQIFPIGLMKKKEITELIKRTGLKLNPTYRYYGHTFDEISYYRMRKAMLSNAEYRQTLIEFFPLMVLDEYRWETLFHAKQ